ncbi:MAG: bifunctional rhamnulose-1-phosphate aldolase/short-chain dehydrogenase, partial [Anaerolineales bacterium]|nr:bifunctional rhamnulose-1-phosphate aldolase/short-chain dehydrogenase [Anaerolineales bacterium]
PVERLRYRSNILGDDQRITNTGGGNTSSKVMMTDPLTGEEVDVLWVKGSGGDLRTSTRANFASLYMDKLLALQNIYDAAAEKGVKTAIEDKMVAMYPHTTYNLNPRASSIDTPLHGFIPYRHVDHMHPISVIAIAASKDQEQLTQEVYGDEVGWVPWQRPGFDLGLKMGEIAQNNPQIKGLVMGQHGLINWANDDKACYELTLTLIEKAAEYIAAHDKGANTFGGAKYQSLPEAEREALLIRLLPTLRGLVSQQNRFIGTVHVTDSVLQFVNSQEAARLAELGTSCPDHFLRTKIKPLYVDWDPQAEDFSALLAKLESGLDHYRQDYAAYYNACKHPNSPAMRDPNPTVILIPGLGLIAWGKNKSESRVTAEFYSLAIQVMRAAEAISQYQGLPRQEAFDIEYWLLEEAKLQRMPPEKELARNVVIVVGAGSGIGKATAHRVAQEGAHVVCVDLDEESAKETAGELTKKYGMGIGVAGTGISACGPAIGLGADITNRQSVQAMLNQVVLAYGGIDNIIVTAGVFVPPSKEGKISDDKWDLTFAVNVKGGYILADEARKIWEAQGLPGTLVLTTSVNAAVAKKGSVAYDTSKAAANHLVRELAIELAPLVRVNGLAPATVVEGSSMFPRDRVISSLVKYNIDFDESEETEALRDKLANFYAQRTLTKSPITLADQAEAAYLLTSSKLSKTSGQIISVDGGLNEAFLR